jgi:hypothetical protein
MLPTHVIWSSKSFFGLGGYSQYTVQPADVPHGRVRKTQKNIPLFSGSMPGLSLPQVKGYIMTDQYRKWTPLRYSIFQRTVMDRSIFSGMQSHSSSSYSGLFSTWSPNAAVMVSLLKVSFAIQAQPAHVQPCAKKKRWHCRLLETHTQHCTGSLGWVIVLSSKTGSKIELPSTPIHGWRRRLLGDF